MPGCRHGQMTGAEDRSSGKSELGVTMGLIRVRLKYHLRGQTKLIPELRVPSRSYISLVARV